MLSSEKIHKTSIGGQAVIEGVMMRGPHKTATVVRKPDGELAREVIDTKAVKNPIAKLPLIRGCVGLVSSLKIGLWSLNYSASFFEDEAGEETPGKFEQFLIDKCGDKFNSILMGVSLVLGLALSVGLFIILPTFLTGLVGPFLPPHPLLKAGIEGVLRILIFLLYMFLVSLMPDIKRVFQYHGAEHKTIACYEHGEELTVENVKKHSRFHPRCGTSFLFLVMIISILVFSLLSWDNLVMRMVMRILLLPVVVGISYELIKLAGRYDNLVTRIISAPGLWLQRLTTSEPDHSMMEVAIASMNEVIPENQGEDQW